MLMLEEESLMVNYFGHELPSFQEILKEKRCRNYVSLTLTRYLATLGVSQPFIDNVKSKLFQIVNSTNNQCEYERQVHTLLVGVTSETTLKQALVERANRIGRQLLPYLIPGNVLDDGCGDGLVGRYLHNRGHGVILADVYQHPAIKSFGLTFMLLGDRERVPFEDNSFSNTNLCTVLHHSVDPLLTLQEAVRVTRQNGRLLVIESVFSISPDKAKDCAGGEYLSAFLSLSPEEQFMVNMFFDHFYNRCFHYSDDPAKKVNVPFNYQTPEEWKEIFHELGCEEVKRIALGIDQPLAPLFHTLHLVEKV